jgi:Flp pilus assembly protein TadG
MQTVRNERGSVIVFVTLMVIILLIMVGLGLDTGQLTYVRNQGQAAVDAAALAAVSGLTQNATQVENRAAAFNSTNHYVESPTNKIGSSNISYVQYDYSTNQVTNYSASFATANGVRVALEGGNGITTPVFLTPLMNLLGISTPATRDVNVSAVAVISARPSIPIAMWQSQCNGNNTVTKLKLLQQNPNSGENSCWTTYLDQSSGGSDIKALFQATETCSGLPAGAVNVGTKIYENKGQVTSVYAVAEQFFMKDHPGRCWFIPVIEGGKNCNNKDPTPIKDWAKICVTDVFKHGSDSYIEGDVTCNQSLHQPSESLCFSHRLVREHKIKM